SLVDVMGPMPRCHTGTRCAVDASQRRSEVARLAITLSVARPFGRMPDAMAKRVGYRRVREMRPMSEMREICFAMNQRFCQVEVMDDGIRKMTVAAGERVWNLWFWAESMGTLGDWVKFRCPLVPLEQVTDGDIMMLLDANAESGVARFLSVDDFVCLAAE